MSITNPAAAVDVAAASRGEVNTADQCKDDDADNDFIFLESAFVAPTLCELWKERR